MADFCTRGARGAEGQGERGTACMASLRRPRICRLRAKRHGVRSVLGGVCRGVSLDATCGRGCQEGAGAYWVQAAACQALHPAPPSKHESSLVGESSVRPSGVPAATPSFFVSPTLTQSIFFCSFCFPPFLFSSCSFSGFLFSQRLYLARASTVEGCRGKQQVHGGWSMCIYVHAGD